MRFRTFLPIVFLIGVVGAVILVFPAKTNRKVAGDRPSLSPATTIEPPAPVPDQGHVEPGTRDDKGNIIVTPNLNPDCPIRTGGVFTSGLSSGNGTQPSTAAEMLSDENRNWLALNCDVVASSASNIKPDTFSEMVKLHRLFTPLLYLYASTLYESPDHRGNVGGWKPEMSRFTLRDSSGKEIRHPDSGGHWMDFGSKEWATHWSQRAGELTRKYGAYGVVAAEMPLNNSFVGNDLAKYRTMKDRIKATGDWLHTARTGLKTMLIPSAIGFDSVAEGKTRIVPPGMQQPELPGRLWDAYCFDMDGAWAEGWLRPYWADVPVSESLWEIQLEAADRASRNGQVFIAAAAYHNDAELEFALASYLLVAHRQGRLVFQPMPLRPGEPTDSGFNLATLKREVTSKQNYFHVVLGVGMQERHQISVLNGPVWRRNFQYGDVYVNSNERITVTVPLAGQMRRVDGSLVRHVELPPQSGVILLYTNK